MEDKEQISQRFELLKMARELLNEDYINRRAEDHNRWIAENEELWRTARRNVPYPPFAQYPTDEAIIQAALNLYNFIHAEPKLSSPVLEAELVQEKNSISKSVPTTDYGFKPAKEDIKLYDVITPVSPPALEFVDLEKDITLQESEPQVMENDSTVEFTDLEKDVALQESELQVMEHAPTLDDVKLLSAKVASTKGLLPGWIRRTIS